MASAPESVHAFRTDLKAAVAFPILVGDWSEFQRFTRDMWVSAIENYPKLRCLPVILPVGINDPVAGRK
jgi:hypothetical protein